MKTPGPRGRRIALAGLLLAALLSACSGAGGERQSAGGRTTIVVTYSVLGAVVRDLVGDSADVVVPMPNGQDPHEWEPSAKDIAAINGADLIVRNGLGLEGGLEKTLDQAQAAGVKIFTASDHIEVRKVGAGEGIPGDDPDQAVGAPDPHLWMDPLAVKSVVAALAAQLKGDLGLDVSARAGDLEGRLEALNDEIEASVSALPAERRRLVTGHESLGYFAQRYGFKLVGAVVPSLTSQAEVSAADLAALKGLIVQNKVTVVFTELGTPAAVTEAIGRETGARVVPLTTHALPEDGTYATFMRTLAGTVVGALRG